VHDLRCIERLEIEPAELNVIAGDNGHGKTSLLEALYLCATSRSFRTSRIDEILRHGARVGSVRGRFSEEAEEGARLPREQSLGIEHGRRVLRLDGVEPPSLAHYATRSPVIVFDPHQMALSMGPALERRRLLDRVALFEHDTVLLHRSRHERALGERQRLLSHAGWARADAELDAFEAIAARHGAALTALRRAAAERLARRLASIFPRVAAPDLVLGVSYRPGGSDDAEEAARALRDGRALDARRKRAGFGPHRDELRLEMGGRAVRAVASQGQHRAVTLALKLAERDCIAARRGLEPLLLLDDVSSELDAERTAALFALLGDARGQIFVTTTRPELLAGLADRLARADFVLHAGRLTRRGATGATGGGLC
jgi:DNA replication and repair protein RecF